MDDLPKQMRLVVKSTDDLARNIGNVPVHLFFCGPAEAAGTVYPAVQNALLACRGLGLGSVVTGFHRMHMDALRDLLDIPENQTAHALLPIGWPSDKIGPVNRRPVTKTASLDSWGNTWQYADSQPEEGLRDRWLSDQ